MSERRTVAALAGVLLCCALIWQTTYAAFSGKTTSDGNSVTSGRVDITNEREGKQILPNLALAPGQTMTTCVTVTYLGSIASEVRLYAASFTDKGLAKFLTVTAEEGRSGGYGDCGSFVRSKLLADTEPMTQFGARTGFSSGLGNWSPDKTASVTYRIKVAFPSTAADNTAENGRVDLAFGWAAEST